MSKSTEQNPVNGPEWVKADRFRELTGYTPHAVRAKGRAGVWQEGKMFRSAPDGRLVIHWPTYNAWCEGAL